MAVAADELTAQSLIDVGAEVWIEPEQTNEERLQVGEARQGRCGDNRQLGDRTVRLHTTHREVCRARRTPYLRGYIGPLRRKLHLQPLLLLDGDSFFGGKLPKLQFCKVVGYKNAQKI